MQLLGRLEIKSRERIARFLNAEHVGRIATIDEAGYPQVIPMNFVHLNGHIYMHSHIRGEKLDNIRRNRRAGFEVDRELEFLPSYFESPTDASLADTLYVSVVIKGTASIVEDREEMSLALNGLMEKYQPEGGYEPLTTHSPALDYVRVIRISPESIRGKYKIGQTLPPTERAELARKILERSGTAAARTLEVMGFRIADGKPEMVDEPSW